MKNIKIIEREFYNSISLNIILSVIFGIIISYIDLHNDEVQPAVLLLLIFSFILGYRNPNCAWLYSILLGLSVITGYTVAEIIKYTPKAPAPDNVWWALLALIPAFVGGYTGVLIKILFKKAIS